jgi:threonine/homoserine/homoserine lactone efflux protein
MTEARVLCIVFIFVACFFISLGRWLIRRARRRELRGFSRKALAWMLVLVGCLFMILGVLLW